MIRKVQVEPGYDCRRECLHERKGDHGIHCDEWWFAVVEGRHAVSLSVFSGKYPESVGAFPLGTSFAEVKGAVWVEHHADLYGGECDYVEGGRCRGETSFLAADVFWKKFGSPEGGIEQPESFWQALEAELRKVIGS